MMYIFYKITAAELVVYQIFQTEEGARDCLRKYCSILNIKPQDNATKYSVTRNGQYHTIAYTSITPVPSNHTLYIAQITSRTISNDYLIITTNYPALKKRLDELLPNAEGYQAENVLFLQNEEYSVTLQECKTTKPETYLTFEGNFGKIKYKEQDYYVNDFIDLIKLVLS